MVLIAQDDGAAALCSRKRIAAKHPVGTPVRYQNLCIPSALLSGAVAACASSGFCGIAQCDA